MSTDKYYIRLSEDGEKADVTTLILSNYPYQEVIMRSYLSQVSSNKIISVEAEIGKMLKNLLEHNLSFVAVDQKTETIAGAVIILSAKFAAWRSFITDEFDEHLVTLAELVDDMREQAYVLEDLGPDAMQFAFLTIDQSHRRNRLGQRLLERSITHLEELGTKMIYGIFTSERSKKVAQSSGMFCAQDIELCNYKKPDGTLKYSDVDEVVVSIMICDGLRRYL